MKITKLQVRNFKSFRDSGEIEFKAGFNVITGQNSAGKTALLQAMALRFAPSPHRSLQTVPAPGADHSQDSSVRITFSLERGELFHLMGASQYIIPSPRAGFMIPGNGPYQPGLNEGTFLDWLSRELEFTLSLMVTKGPTGERAISEGVPLGKYPAADPEGARGVRMLLVSVSDGQLKTGGMTNSNNPEIYLTSSMYGLLATRIYRFTAERFNVGRIQFGSSATLASDARNLPEAVNTLNEDPERLRKLNELLHEVLPQVRQISIRPIGTEVQIIVWPHDPRSLRADLAIPVEECGSGIGQVIAILYVVITSNHPQVILIDEPQSFLHPGAVRKLIEILKLYPQHQYVLSTHSPAVITASDPGTIIMIRANGPESIPQPINAGNTKDLQEYLSEIGVRLSDVFGADNILWVEGRTEEACFPRIIAKVVNRRLMGTAVMGVVNTGDLHGRDRKKISEVYQRLSTTTVLLPPALAFCFDSECLSDSDKQDLIRASRNLVHFLPRRMYENYLLDVPALTAVMNGIEGFREARIQEDEVRDFVELKRADQSFYCRGLQRVPNDWTSHIDGARVLREMFSDLSQNQVAYEKTRHSVAITEWILQNMPTHFQDLANWLLALLPAPV